MRPPTMVSVNSRRSAVSVATSMVKGVRPLMNLVQSAYTYDSILLPIPVAQVCNLRS